MEELRVLIEATIPKNGEFPSAWFDLPIDETEFEELLGVEADSEDYRLSLIHISPEGYLRTGAVSREFEIKENGKIVDLTSEESSIYNQIKRGDIEGVKIGCLLYTSRCV